MIIHLFMIRLQDECFDYIEVITSTYKKKLSSLTYKVAPCQQEKEINSLSRMYGNLFLLSKRHNQTLNGRADFLNNQYIFVLSKGHL